MQYDRQSIVQALIEGALRTAADPSVTAVLRSWDHYDPGDTSQPLTPFLTTSVTDDIPYGIGIGLYRCALQISIVVTQSPAVRDDFGRIRESVRSVMAAVPRLAASGVIISGVREVSCSEPEHITESGDIVLVQTLGYSVWFEAPVTPPVVINPEIYLADRDPETGLTYTTTQAVDPRRITRWTPGAVQTAAQGYGAWADRATLDYFAPVTPPGTSAPASSVIP